jgi:hypothetical protein
VKDDIETMLLKEYVHLSSKYFHWIVFLVKR